MENYLTKTDVVVGIVAIVPVHVEPVVVPVAVEHIAIRIELLPDLIFFTDNFFQNYLRSLATQPDFFRRIILSEIKHVVLPLNWQTDIRLKY